MQTVYQGEYLNLFLQCRYNVPLQINIGFCGTFTGMPEMSNRINHCNTVVKFVRVLKNQLKL